MGNTYMKVKIRRSILNINFHRTIFGGSIFSAFDPYFPTMYYNIFALKNRKLEIWLKSANIKYKRPATTHLTLEFNITKEDIQLAEKHKTARSIVWKVPGMLAGNEVPQYTDNAGSISRRLLVFSFLKRVKKGDTRLGKKLYNELPFIIQASNRAYQEAVNKYQEEDIWSIAPEYFKKTKEAMAENTNALMHFLSSDNVQLDKSIHVRQNVFVEAFTDHCRKHNLPSKGWNEDYYLGPFAMKDITVKKCRKKYPRGPGGKLYTGTFYFGVDIIDEFENSFDPEEVSE